MYNQYCEFRAPSVFQGKHKVAQKSWMVKNIFNTVKNFRGNSVFRASTSCWKFWMWKVYSIQWKFSGQLWFFRASASCSKIVNGEKMFNTMYIHLGPIRAIWASVVCNLDQSHDWLHGRNLVGNMGDVFPHFFRWGYNIPCPPTFFSLGFVFGEVSKIKVMFVTFCVKSFSS